MRNAKPEDAGEVLAEVLLSYMQDLGVVDGLGEMGYASADIPTLVQGTLSQVKSSAHGILLHVFILLLLFRITAHTFKIEGWRRVGVWLVGWLDNWCFHCLLVVVFLSGTSHKAFSQKFHRRSTGPAV